MQKYTHIFFDLDKTLWDFYANSAESIKEIYEKYDLKNVLNTDFGSFNKSFLFHNDQLWEEFKKGNIPKSTIRSNRFRLAIKSFGVNSNKLANEISEEYFSKIATRKTLMPHAAEVIEYLFGKYSLNIITNGFKETQVIKLKSSGLYKFFDYIIISELVGYHKPEKGIFKKAIEMSGAKRSNSLMVGDDLGTDILGAKNSGIDQVYYNPEKIPHNEKITFEISSLLELKDII